MSNNKILITGASGFVGKHTIAALKDKTHLSAVSRCAQVSGVEQMYSWENITDLACDFDVIIHLAGLAHDTHHSSAEQAYFDVNVGLTEKLVTWVNSTAKQPVKFIYLSSVKVFGEQEYLKSDSPKIPSSVYGKSKLLAEQFIEQNLAKEHTYHILEPVMIYGKGNKGNLPKLYNVLMKGFPYPFSGWQNKRSLLAIDNLQFVFNKLIEQECASGSFMVCDDEPISTYDMLKCICKGNKSDFIHFPLPPFFVRFLMSATRMLGMQFLDKVLGTLVCDNTALKDNIGIELMPFSTKERLQKLDFTS